MCAPPADIIDTLTNTRISRRECALAAADSARPIACAATPKAGFTLRAETSRTFRVTDPRVACAALGVAGAVTGGPPSRSPCPMLGILRGTNLQGHKTGAGHRRNVRRALEHACRGRQATQIRKRWGAQDTQPGCSAGREARAGAATPSQDNRAGRGGGGSGRAGYGP